LAPAMDELRVGIRELKNKLSDYLRRIKTGETVIITDRGKPIAKIVPIQPTVDDRLRTLVDAGLVEWNGKKLRAYQPIAVNKSDHQLSDLVVEDRK
jgi:prevent-host-death family protein